MKKNIWFIMGGTILLTNLLIPVIQGYMLTSTPESPTVLSISAFQTLAPTLTEAAPILTTTPTSTPSLSPNVVARQQMEPLDQQVQELDALVEQTTPEKLGQYECPYVSRGSGECWVYHFGTGNVILIQGYAYVADLYTYDLDDDGQPEILKWNLGRDRQFDVIEYDVDGDGVLDYVIADLNSNGQFDHDEIYMYEDATERWRALVPGALPPPLLPVFPNV